MAFTSTTAFSSAITSALGEQTDVTSTPDTDITGGANLIMTTVEIDAVTNSLPNSETAFVKFYDDGNPTVGTAAPDMTLPCIGGQKQIYQISGGGYTFTTAISMACCTDGGGDAGTTNPTTDVIVRVTSE